jgi:hypothetical protein
MDSCMHMPPTAQRRHWQQATLQEPSMANSNLPHDERTPAPAAVNAGPQSDPGGAGGEPKGARVESRAQDQPGPSSQPAPPRRAGHSSDQAKPGYQARPAGQSGVGEQDAPILSEPQGEGQYIATDRGDKPLRSG